MTPLAPVSVSGIPNGREALSYHDIAALIAAEIRRGAYGVIGVAGVGVDDIGPYYDPMAYGYRVAEDTDGVFIEEVLP